MAENQDPLGRAPVTGRRLCRDLLGSPGVGNPTEVAECPWQEVTATTPVGNAH